MKQEHRKKMVAPIVVTIVILLYYAAMGCVIFLLPNTPLWLKAVLILVPLIASCLILHVMLQRIREIKSGEEDDLNQY